MGEAACTAFGDRLLQCVSTDYTDISCNTMPDHVTHPVFDRCMNPAFQLPNRVQATLLVRRVDKFIGSNYHLMLRKSFFEQFDRAYNSQQLPDARWACHLFALLALGELYSNCKTNPDDDRVPGMSWFIISVRLLQDLYEEASLEQVQILILLASFEIIAPTFFLLTCTVPLRQRPRPSQVLARLLWHCNASCNWTRPPSITERH